MAKSPKPPFISLSFVIAFLTVVNFIQYHTPKNALSLNDELIELRKRVKEQDKEIRRLKEENEFLEEASAFFAASRRKSAKNRD